MFSLPSLCQLPFNTHLCMLQRWLCISTAALCVHFVLIMQSCLIWASWEEDGSTVAHYGGGEARSALDLHPSDLLLNHLGCVAEWWLTYLPVKGWRWIQRWGMQPLPWQPWQLFLLFFFFWMKWNGTPSSLFVNNMQNIGNSFSCSVAGCLYTPIHCQCETMAVFARQSCAHFSCLCFSIISQKELLCYQKKQTPSL